MSAEPAQRVGAAERAAVTARERTERRHGLLVVLAGSDGAGGLLKQTVGERIGADAVGCLRILPDGAPVHPPGDEQQHQDRAESHAIRVPTLGAAGISIAVGGHHQRISPRRPSPTRRHQVSNLK